MPNFNPQSIRNTLNSLGQSLYQSPEEFKAWNQNLGHEHVMTTLYSYGHVQEQRQGEIMKQLKNPRTFGDLNVEDIAKAIAEAIAKQNKEDKT